MSDCMNGCKGRPVKARGLCNRCYQAARATAALPSVRSPRWVVGSTPEEKLLLNRRIDETSGCWRWTRATNPKGYGSYRFKGHSSGMVHRTAYEIWVGPIPDGLTVDHVKARGCVHKDCFNPDHLELVTPAENTRRGDGGAKNRQKTHCRNGHAFSPENTYVNPTTGGRFCRACMAKHRRAYRERLAGEA